MLKKSLILFITLSLMLNISCVFVPQDDKNNTNNNSEEKDVDSSYYEGVLNNSNTEDIIEAYEITYSKARLDLSYSTSSSYYILISEITNTGNVPLYLDTGSMELENEKGELVGLDEITYPYPNLILPGEKSYMQSRINVDKPIQGIPKAIPRFNVKSKNVKPIRLKISDITITDEKYSAPKTMGRITNNTNSDISGVYVVFIYYDINKSPIGVVHDYIISIPSGQTRAFETLSLELSNNLKKSDINSYLAYAYQNYSP